MKNVFRFSVFFVVVLLYGCCAYCGICNDIDKSPGVGLGSTVLNGTVLKIEKGDTTGFSGAQVIVKFAKGFDTDCGVHYSESDILLTNSNGEYQHFKNCYNACNYDIRILDSANIVIYRGSESTGASYGCPDSLDNKVFYIKK